MKELNLPISSNELKKVGLSLPLNQLKDLTLELTLVPQGNPIKYKEWLKGIRKGRIVKLESLRMKILDYEVRKDGKLYLKLEKVV